MKKTTALLLTIPMALSLTACDQATPKASESPSSGAVESTPEVSLDETTLEGILERVTADASAVCESLEQEWEAIQVTIGETIDGYIQNEQALQDYYDLVCDEVTALYTWLSDATVAYYRLAADTIDHEDRDELYDVTDDLYDAVYDDCLESLYDTIYDDVYEDIYDIDGIIDDAYSSMDYSDWLDVRSDFYSTWLDARSDFFSDWLDARSDFFGTWLDIRSAFWDGDFDVDAVIAGDDEQEKQPAEEQPAEETPSQAPEATPSPAPETPDNDGTEGSEEPSEEPSSGGISPEFKAAMDECEAFVDEYVAFMKKYQESQDLSMMGEYLSMLQRYTETMSALDEIDEGALSDQEALYYAEVMLRINQKLLSVA